MKYRRGNASSLSATTFSFSEASSRLRGSNEGRHNVVDCDNLRTDGAPICQWEKILYKRQAFPDNYVDESFLESLVTNASVRPHQIGELILGSVVVTQQLTSVAFFLLCFTALQTGQWTITQLASLQLTGLVISGGIVLVGRGVRGSPRPAALGVGAVKRRVGGDAWYDIVLQGAAIVALMWGVSPIILTLTHNYASESVWVYAMLLYVLHLLFHEYRLAHTTQSG